MNASPASVRLVCARRLDEVLPLLAEVEAAADAGACACGFISYEAAAAFEARAAVHAPGELPLAWFLLGPPEQFEAGAHSGEAFARVLRLQDSCPGTGPAVTGFAPALSAERHGAAVETIRKYLAAGNTYQVNYTFPLAAPFQGDWLAWFEAVCRAQGPGEYYAFDTGRFQVLCASPELFFSLRDGRLLMRPMKGTRPRGRWLEEDARMAEALRTAEKDRAENVMIVDMVRNDLGRIALPGTVAVEHLFEVERYETVWQMTSTVSAQTRAGLREILGAVFPCASITGAPKLETMRIIRELEPQPRGVYCGAAGWWGPGKQGRFSVAIRTAVVDRARQRAQYSVGSGITWNSTPAEEYDECLQKAAVLTAHRPAFELLETLLWEDGAYFLLELHLERLQQSAAYFGYACDIEQVRDALAQYAVKAVGETRARVRLLISRDGSLRLEHVALQETKPVLRVALAAAPVDSRDIFLYHKTTRREVYERRRAAHPGCEEVVLQNERGELTEGTFTNIVLQDSVGCWTPPRGCGLLGGVFREQLLRADALRERVLRPEDLQAPGARLWLINSVRKWCEAAWISQ